MRHYRSRAFTLIELPVMRKRKGKAFTLIELLVVIAIIALLLSLLTPMLSKAKEITRRVLCATNQKNLGTGAYGFAGENEGRGPGRGLLGRAGSNWQSSYSWANILNTMYYRESRVQRIGRTAKKNMLYCPSMKPFGNNLSPRAYQWNLDATGGPSWGSNLPQGPYGKVGDIDRANARLREVHSNYYFKYYYLGAILDRFPRASEKILVREGERGGDVCSARWPYYVPWERLGDNPSFGEWCAGGGQFSFRHVRGNDPAMYKYRATANFLFVDGHVETFTPMEHTNESVDYSIQE